MRRRSTLPSPRPSSSVSLWNILRNNIGKDLSKVAMPVQLNEPINTLQRLCEELEYSELLETANQTQDPYQRMVSEEDFSCKHSPLFKILRDGVLCRYTLQHLQYPRMLPPTTEQEANLSILSWGKHTSATGRIKASGL